MSREANDLSPDLAMPSSSKMTLTSLIASRSPGMLVAAVVLSLIAGLCYSAIIPFLMHGIELTAETSAVPVGRTWLAEHAAPLFFALCALTFLTKVVSLVLVTYLVKDVTADLRIRLCRKINLVGVREVEKLGMARLTNILVEDIGRVSFAAVCLPMVAVYVTNILGMLGYLAYLDWRVFVAVVVVIAILLFANRFPLRKSTHHMERSRLIRDRVQAGIRGVVFGAYELKLAREKSQEFIEEEIVAPEREAARVDKIADTYLHFGGSFIEVVSFFAVGVVAFVLPKYIAVSSSGTYGIAMILLYVMLPIFMLYMLVPNIQRGRVALEQIQHLEDLPEEPSSGEPLPEWSVMEVRDLQYEYHLAEGKEAGFRLQPVTLRFAKGEVVFIVGGNGSGKSTLSKLLSLHYAPQAGEIYFDSTRVTSKNIAAARERIAVIYSSYYLFEKVYGHSRTDAGIVNEYLELFGLQNKTQYCDGRFSTTLLSDGQRRRLALVVALLDDRDVYILDEWAADQDPEFREIFYTKILQQLRQAGKLVIVITHDDRYFDHADRIVAMEYGGIRQISAPAERSVRFVAGSVQAPSKLAMSAAAEPSDVIAEF